MTATMEKTIRLAVVIPTIAGREDFLAGCRDSYERKTTLRDIKVEVNILVQSGHPTCGEAWVAGIRAIEEGIKRGGWEPDYLHLTCDDIEATDGWLDAATMALNVGVNPCPHQIVPEHGREIWGRSETPVPDGDPGHVNTLPFLSWSDYRAIAVTNSRFTEVLAKLHYYSDDMIAWHMAHLGYDAAYCADYRFIHHFAQVGRGAGMTEEGRMKHDERIFTAAIAEVSW